MTVIEASSVRCQTMADGTLRVTMDIEPRNAQSAFALFAAPGTPMALAALKAARAEPVKKEPIGELCQWAVMRCEEPDFWRFLSVMSMSAIEDKDMAKLLICRTCNIKSRRELDTNEIAATTFNQKIRRPYADWLEAIHARA